MNARALLLVSCSLLAGRALAQGAVLLPPAAAGIDQAGAGAAPWGSGTASTRTLVVYDSSSLTAFGITGPVTITGLRWRANNGAGFGSGVYDNVQVSLSTAAFDHLALSTSFAANHGGDLTLVYSGEVPVEVAASSAPSSFYVQVPLTAPFVYDPAGGFDLAVDVQCDGTGWIGSAGAPADVATVAGVGSRLTAASAVATSGTVTTNSAPVLELVTDWAGPPASLVINEFVYDYTGANREFVELYNAGSSGVNLLGWTLRATTSGGTTTLATLPSVVLAPGQYYVVGNAVGAPPVLAPDLALAAALPNGNTTLSLRNNAGVVIDAVQYGASAGTSPLFEGEGWPLFGAHHLDPVSPTSWSRHRDGYDTGDNGLDFRIAPWTPKAQNDLPNLLPYAANFDALTVGQAVPSWSGSVAAPVAVNPGSVSTFNPSAVPASPQGGNCASFATPNDTAGGRSYLLLTDATSRMSFRGQVYFDATLAPAGQSYAWSIGVCGTTDSDYAMPFPGGPAASDLNGDTGVTWTYVVTDAEATLYLISNAGGGRRHSILRRHQITTSAWRSLQLDLYDNRVFARYDGVLTQATVANSAGCLYVGIRSQAAGAGLAALRYDAISTDPGDVCGIGGNGPGCDGNCPPKDNRATVVERGPVASKRQPVTGYYAFRVHAETAISFDAVYVLTHVHNKERSTAATLGLWNVNGTKPGTLLVAAQSLAYPDKDEDAWWTADLALYQQSQSDFFIDYYHDGKLDLPVAAVTKDPAYKPQQLQYYYRADVGDAWILQEGTLPWAYKFLCTSTSSEPEANMKKEMNLGGTFTPTLDNAFYPTIGFLWLGFVALPGIDLGFLGAPGCQLWVDISAGFGLATITDTTGHAEFTIPLANDPMSLGAQVYQQWFVYDPTVNPLGWIASNSLRTTIH